MLSLEEFLRTPAARRIVRESVGEVLADLGSVLATRMCGGSQLAYDVTAVLVGPSEINLARDAVNPSGKGPDYLQVVDDLKALTIAQRMTLRASASVAGTPLLKQVADTTGLPLALPQTIPVMAGNALPYLSPLNADPDEAIVLAVCCAGLSGTHCERYAEAMAALCKFALLGELANRNACLDHMSDAA